MNIPHVLQENDYFCGPAIIAMTLGAFGRTITQQEAAVLAQTNEEVGTPIEGLVGALKGLGLSVDAAEKRTIDDLAAAVSEEKVCVVCYTEPVLEWGHYAIVEKIEKGAITLIDPDSRTGTTSLVLEEFERRWKDPLFTKSERWAAFVSAK
ncbi:MAG TPA: cysteine peptidase family C39 domain-containing protein [Candidatus Paceibacterota bacterium]|nr:cysteine peptidase family C39 domain-containing protein [Candidatus Paceibacterota bacterium]